MKNPLDWKIFRLTPEEIAGLIILGSLATGAGVVLAGGVLLWIFFGGH